LRLPRLAIGLAAVLVIVACRPSTTEAPQLPGAIDQPPMAASPLPAPTGLVTAGQLTVAIVPTLPVQQYLDKAGKPAGFDIDLAGAIASQLGLKVAFQQVEREDDIVPGFADKDRKYDFGLADQVDSPALDAGAKTLPYFTTGQALLVPASDTSTQSPADLCGQSIGALRNSAGELVVLRRNDVRCKDNKLQYQPYDDGAKALPDLRAGSLKAYIDEYATVVFFARVQSGLRVVPHPLGQAKEVMVFSISDSALHDAVAGALDRLKADGTYAALLKKWGLDEGAVDAPVASPVPSPS
jgi:polar amino acid transport system substrate-binding protein